MKKLHGKDLKSDNDVMDKTNEIGEAGKKIIYLLEKVPSAGSK